MKFNKILISEYSTKNVNPLQDYSPGSKHKAFWICGICAHEWKTRIGHRTNGSGCPRCGNIKAHYKRKQKIKSISETHPNIAAELLMENCDMISHGCNKKYNWLCKKCNHQFISTPNRRCSSSLGGCPYCSGRLASDTNSLEKNRPDLVDELAENIPPSSMCHFSNKKVKWKCKKCLKEWEATVNSRSQGRGCPSCAWKNSKPQKEIESILFELKINFVKEYKDKNCKDKYVMPFDFAILEKNKMIGLIEYQGEQHYFPIWGQKRLELSKKHDEIKSNYCIEAKIPLLIISFRDKIKFKNIISDFKIKLNSIA